MRPLTFLFTRTLANGVKRALTSPKRTISLLFFAIYYFGLIAQPFRHDSVERPSLPFGPSLSLPSRYVLDGAVFGIMAFASMAMLSGVLTYRGGFRPADVDVLFPTPVSPRVVLAFRVLRDYLTTLILPLFFGVLGFRATRIGLQTLFTNYPAHGGDMVRMTWLAWMLMSLAWVAIGYGASLFVGRSDLRSDFNRKVIVYGITAAFILLAGYIAAVLHEDLSWTAALGITHAWPLRIVLLPATAATAVAIGGIEGDPVTLSAGVAGMLGLIALGYAGALSQVGWLYDQAAARGFDSFQMRKLRRGGNQYALFAEMARRGKLRRRWLADRLSSLRFRGGAALIWKEAMLQARGPLSGLVIFGLIMLAVFGGAAWMTNLATPERSGLIVISGMCVMSYFLSLMVGFGGFTETLRRVDLLKPLPFTPARTVFWELLGKAPLPAAMLTIGACAATVIRPSVGIDAIAGVILSVSLLLEMTGAVMLTLVLFPDYDDQTQRGLSGIFMVFAILVCSSPGLGLFYGLVVGAGLPSIVAVFPAIALLLGVTACQAAVAGAVYAGYNPTE